MGCSPADDTTVFTCFNYRSSAGAAKNMPTCTPRYVQSCARSWVCLEQIVVLKHKIETAEGKQVFSY